MQLPILGDFSRGGSVLSNAHCSAELLQQGESPLAFWRSLEGFSLHPEPGGAGYIQLCPSAGLLASLLSYTVRTAAKIAPWSLESSVFLPFLDMWRSFFAKNLTGEAGIHACCGAVPGRAGKELIPGAGTGSPPPPLSLLPLLPPSLSFKS